MSDHSELKIRAEEILEIERLHPCGSTRVILVNPETVLELIAEAAKSEQDYKDVVGTIELRDIEIERLKAEVERLRTAEGDAMTYKAGMENCAAQRDQLKRDNEALRKIISESATACGAAVSVECSLEFMGHLPGEISAVVGGLRKDAKRYQWLRDKSEALHSFYLSVPIWMTGVKFKKESVDISIDAAIKQGEHP